MSRRFIKGLILSIAAAISFNIILMVPAIAVQTTANGWVKYSGTWYYYSNGSMVKNGWAKDSKGWCFLNAVDGSWVQEGWAKDSHGWGYIQDGYWVQHSMWAKDSNGWNYIQDNGYWDGKPAVAVNPDSDARVKSISAANSTTLVLTGTNLAKLTASDIKVSDNLVVAYSASIDQTTATVILENSLIGDDKSTVTVKSQVFAVGYSLDVATAAVITTSYDNDTSDQYVAITVNDKAATVSDLQAAGYDVKFSALTSKSGGGDITNSIFSDASKGLLLDNLNPYLGSSTSKSPYIQVIITKGSDVFISALQQITILNKNLVANSISSYILTNNTSKYAVEFEQNSTTLVTGDTAYFKSIKINVDGNKQTVYPGTFSVKSSNSASVYADSNGALMAIAPGTAVLNITYGNVTKLVDFTVVSDKRELSKVVIQKQDTDTTITSLKTAKKQVNLELAALDQYGDPFNAAVYPRSSNTKVVGTIAPISIDASKNGTPITLTPIDTGSTTIYFYDSNSYVYRIPSSALTVNVLENGDVNNSVLNLYTPQSDGDAEGILTGTKQANYSEDSTIDMSCDNYVVYELEQFTSEGVSLGYAAITNPITISSSGNDVLDGNAVTVDGDKIIVKAGTNTGTATIKVIDPVTKLLYTKTITVVDQANTIISASFKTISDASYSKTYNYKSVLTITGSSNDPIVSGLILKQPVSQAVRIHLIDDSNGILYIDKNGDGLCNKVTSTDDTLLGSFTILALGDIADKNTSNGVTVAPGEDGTIIFEVLDIKGRVVSAVSIADNF